MASASDEPVGLGSTSDDPVGMGSTSDNPVGMGSTSDDPVGMASTSDDPVGMASTSDDPVCIATTSDDSDSMVSSSDELVMASCCTSGKSKKAKKRKKDKACIIEEDIDAWVARWMVHIERSKILEKYMQDGQWDEANGKITNADYREMKELKDFEIKQLNILRERLDLKERLVDEMLTWTPMPGRSRGST